MRFREILEELKKSTEKLSSKDVGLAEAFSIWRSAMRLVKEGEEILKSAEERLRTIEGHPPKAGGRSLEDFDRLVKRLEEISDKIAATDPKDIEEMMALFEEATAIYAECRRILEGCAVEVKKLEGETPTEWNWKEGFDEKLSQRLKDIGETGRGEQYLKQTPAPPGGDLY